MAYGGSSSTFYVATAVPSTAIIGAVTCDLVEKNARNVVINYGSRVEVRNAWENGYNVIIDRPVPIRLNSIIPLKQPNVDTDVLFLCDIFCNVSIVQLDSRQSGLSVLWKDKAGLPSNVSSSHHPCRIDPSGRTIGLWVHERMLRLARVDFSSKSTPMPRGSHCSVSTLDYVLDNMSGAQDYCISRRHILPGTTMGSNVMVCVLCQDSVPGSAKCVRGYILLLAEAGSTAAVAPLWEVEVDVFASLIYAMPSDTPGRGGIMVIGERSATLLLPRRTKTTPKRIEAVVPIPTSDEEDDADRRIGSVASAVITVDSGRVLIAHSSGKLFLVVFLLNGKSIGSTILRVEKWSLGKVDQSRPSCLLLLNRPTATEDTSQRKHVVLIGSAHADSHVIEVGMSRLYPPLPITILNSHQCLAPISDLSLSRNGTLITASGIDPNGCLHVVRTGIGVDDHASVDIPAPTGVWALCGDPDALHHTLIVLSFVAETRVMLLHQSIEETDIPGFDMHSCTLLAASTHHGLIQVTPFSVRLVNTATKTLVNEWRPDDSSLRICVADSTQNEVFVGSGNTIWLLRVKEDGFELITTCVLEADLSCGIFAGVSDSDVNARFIVVGLWSGLALFVLELPGLTTVSEVRLGGDIVSRSIAPLRVGNRERLLVGLGDGQLVDFELDLVGPLRLRHRGSQRMSSSHLKVVQCVTRNNNKQGEDITTGHKRGPSLSEKADQFLFVCSHAPQVVFVEREGIATTPLQLGAVRHACSLIPPPEIAEAIPGHHSVLVVALANGMSIISVADFQKWQVHRVSLGDTPTKIALHSPSACALVLSERKRTRQPEIESSALPDHTTVRLVSIEGTPRIVWGHPLPFGVVASAVCASRIDPYQSPSSPILDPMSPNVMEDNHSEMMVVSMTDSLGSSSPCRLVPFRVDGDLYNDDLQLTEIGAVPMEETVHAIASTDAGVVVAACGSTVHLLTWTHTASGSVTLVHSRKIDTNGTLGVSLASHSNYVSHCDLVESVMLSHVTSDIVDNNIIDDVEPLSLDDTPTTATAIQTPQASMDILARDNRALWPVSSEFLTVGSRGPLRIAFYSSADFSLHIVQYRGVGMSPVDSDASMTMVPETSLVIGDTVTMITRGDFCRRRAVRKIEPDSVIIGTSLGTVHVVALLSETQFDFLKRLQASLSKYSTSISVYKPEDFIFADVLGEFLALEAESRERISSDMDVLVDDLLAEVEEINAMFL